MLKEDELYLARREIEILESTQQMTISSNNQTTDTSNNTQEETTSRLTVSMMADMLNYFNGNNETYEVWEKQIRLLRPTYLVTDYVMKIVMSSRLKGEAFE